MNKYVWNWVMPIVILITCYTVCFFTVPVDDQTTVTKIFYVLTVFFAISAALGESQK